MPPVLTTNAVITCVHGGRVQLVNGAPTVKAGSGMVLCEGDIMGKPIAGCPFPVTPAGNKPCTTVAAVFAGASTRVKAGHRPVYTTLLNGLTDGVPPAPLLVVSPGQVTVGAAP